VYFPLRDQTGTLIGYDVETELAWRTPAYPQAPWHGVAFITVRNVVLVFGTVTG
jgi:hypothetical protein